MRYNMYHSSKSVSLEDLPSTPHSSRGHILRALHATYTMINCLPSVEDPDPRQYGYEHVNGSLVPIIFHRLVLEDLVPNCTACTSCVRSSCPCKSNNILCRNFCSVRETELVGPLSVLTYSVQMMISYDLCMYSTPACKASYIIYNLSTKVFNCCSFFYYSNIV